MKALIITSPFIPWALGYPGLDHTIAKLQARHGSPLQSRSTELLGDLQDNNALTAVGSEIKAILQGASAVADGSTYTPPAALASAACTQSTLCIWSHIIGDLSTAFTDCTALARGAIRQGFHDAAAWDRDSAYGGADGSLLLSDDELARPENRGLEDIAAQTKAWHGRYAGYNISMADLVQTAAVTATVSCPGGPRIRHFVGRKDDGRPGPTGKLPLPEQDAQTLIDLFAAKTFTADGLVALVGAHTVARQRFVDPGRYDAPQDSTPAVWDSAFYAQTLGGDNETGVLIFHSDWSISGHEATKERFGEFAGDRKSVV